MVDISKLNDKEIGALMQIAQLMVEGYDLCHIQSQKDPLDHTDEIEITFRKWYD